MEARVTWSWVFILSLVFLGGCSQPAPIPEVLAVDEEIELEGEEEDTFTINEEFLNQIHDETGEFWDKGWSLGLATFDEVMVLNDHYVIEFRDVVVDEFGSYKRVRVSLPDEYIKVFPLTDSKGRTLNGFTEDELRDALRFYSDFVLNETLDSPALDNTEAWGDWWENTGKNATSVSIHQEVEDYKNSMMPVRKETGVAAEWTPLVFFAGHEWNSYLTYGMFFTPLTRDGESRTMNRQLKKMRINEQVNSNTIFVESVASTGLAFDFYDWQTRVFVENAHDDFTYDYNKRKADKYAGEHHYKWYSVYLGLSLSLENGEWKISGWKMQPFDLDGTSTKETRVDDNELGYGPHFRRDDLRYTWVD